MQGPECYNRIALKKYQINLRHIQMNELFTKWYDREDLDLKEVNGTLSLNQASKVAVFHET